MVSDDKSGDGKQVYYKSWPKFIKFLSALLVNACNEHA